MEGLLGGGVLRLPSGTVDGVVPVSEGVGLVRAWAELGWLASTEAAFGLCGLPGVSRTVVDCVGQAALLLLTKSCSASLGVRYPSAE